MSSPKPPRKCIVRGSINNDEYFFVDHIAKPGETKASTGHATKIGGKGANQAVAISKAGGQVELYGTIGKDGVWIKERLGELGVGVDGVLVSEEPTGRAIIQVSEDGENSIILFAGANHSQVHESSSSSPPAFTPATHLLLQNEIHPLSALHALSEASKSGLTTILNPSPIPPADTLRGFPWHQIDWLLINEGEAASLVQALDGAVTAIESAPDLLVLALARNPLLENTNIVCTLGAQGVLAFLPGLHTRDQLNKPDSNGGEEGEALIRLPAARLEGSFRDTTGAGDCFTGYFVTGLMELGPKSESEGRVGIEVGAEDVAKLLTKCNLAAGMSVEKPGTIDSIPSKEEVEERERERERDLLV